MKALKALMTFMWNDAICRDFDVH